MNICVAINRCFVAGLRLGSKIIGGDDAYITEPFLMRILNGICGTVAVAETAWIVFFLFSVQLPYEYEHNGFSPFTIFRIFFGFWLAYSVPYHYYKCRIATPIKLPKTSSGSHCTICDNHKPRLTSHCSTCGTCIYKMDHHCPWVGQCVGAHNQAHFFLFIWNVFLSTVLVLYMEYGFWMDHWGQWTKAVQEGTIKRSTGGAAFTMVIVTVLHFLMLSFLCTYGFLVSGGLTYVMKMFKKHSEESKMKLTTDIVYRRWRQYLAVRPNQWILVALFVPSDRIVRDFNFFSS